MTSNLKRPVEMRRRIARILCRALMCVTGLAAAATESNAQPTVLAYRFDDYYLMGNCDTGCALVVSPYIVTPWAGSGGYQPTWSPDRARIAFTDGYNIFVIPSTAGTPIQLTNATSDAFLAPAWSPDGGQIAFVRYTGGPTE